MQLDGQGVGGCWKMERHGDGRVVPAVAVVVRPGPAHSTPSGKCNLYLDSVIW